MTVSAAQLVAAYPQATQVNTSYPDVVTAALSYAHTRINETAAGDHYDAMVMLAAMSWLYDHEYFRDLHEDKGSLNRFEKRLVHMMRLKGAARRTLWSGSDFGSS